MFITLEGLDFSGKSTQTTLLVEKLKSLEQKGPSRGLTHDAGRQTPPVPVHVLREPGGTAISEQIRGILLDRASHGLTATAEILLFSASRTQLVSEVILPALNRGEIVVCDRFVDSTTAYQGYGRGLGLESVAAINKVATLGLLPDLTLLIDIPIEEIERRKHAAGLPFDRMEESGKDFYERVRAGYVHMARQEQERFVVVDGMQPPQAVHREVWKAVERKMAITPLHAGSVKGR
jgi:dTMP kinase